jgi:hypothetical protein
MDKSIAEALRIVDNGKVVSIWNGVYAIATLAFVLVPVLLLTVEGLLLSSLGSLISLPYAEFLLEYGHVVFKGSLWQAHSYQAYDLWIRNYRRCPCSFNNAGEGPFDVGVAEGTTLHSLMRSSGHAVRLQRPDGMAEPSRLLI